MEPIDRRGFLKSGEATLAAGALDFVLQVPVHLAHADLVARHFNAAHIVDVCIAPNKPLAIITRREVVRFGRLSN